MLPIRTRITRLAVERFRNHAATALDVPADASLVVLAGDNGAGKTNLLEALSLLSVGRGLRGATLSSIANGGEGGFTVAADLLGDPALPAVTLGTGTSADAPERRLLRVNGAPAALNSLTDWLDIAWLTPAMDRLFSDSAGGRRRFLDRLVLALHHDHARQASRYEAAMRARTRLLTAEEPADPEWLAALEAAMVEHGLALSAARGDTVARLDAVCAGTGDDLFPRARLALEGWQAPMPDGSPAAFADALRRGRGADAAAGRALTGPHRADLAVTHADKGMPAALASTGEQKALLLGIMLAHTALVTEATGRTPLLLLDEVAAHLDANRREALFRRLAALGSQSWVTGTELALFEGVDAACFRIAEGHAEPV